jgi:hypothetical protein
MEARPKISRPSTVSAIQLKTAIGRASLSMFNTFHSRKFEQLSISDKCRDKKPRRLPNVQSSSNSNTDQLPRQRAEFMKNLTLRLLGNEMSAVPDSLGATATAAATAIALSKTTNPKGDPKVQKTEN